MFIIAAQAR